MLTHLISHIHSTTPCNESILVFLDGIGSITHQAKLLERTIDNCDVIVLHSEVKGDNKNNDERVFNIMCPQIRKIILSTNIAETSLTISDAKHVIDCGYAKKLIYDVNTDSKQLLLQRISQASANQRAGRTGRTQDGKCYRLYPRFTYDSMDSHTKAEILVTSLTNTCLRIKSLIRNQTIGQFLSKAIEPPPTKSVLASVAMLKTIGAIDSNEMITNFGKFALSLPVDTKYSKAIQYAISLRCLETVTYIICMMSTTSHFKVGKTDDERAIIANGRRKFQRQSFSDFHVLWKIYQGFIDCYEKHDFCRTHGLSFTSMDLAHGIFTLIKNRLASLNYPHTRSKLAYGSVNVNGKNWDIVHMCLAASLYPNLCHIAYNDNNGLRELHSRFNESVSVQTQSIVREELYKIDAFVMYDECSITQ